MKISILWRLAFSFLIIVSFSFVLGYKGLTYMQELDNSNKTIYAHPFEVAKNSRDIHVYILDITRLLDKIFYEKKIDDIFSIDAKVDNILTKVNKKNDLLKKEFIGERVSYMAYLATYEDFINTQTQMMNYLKIGNFEKAKKIFKKYYFRYEQRLLLNIIALEEHADNTAKVLQTKSMQDVDNARDEYTQILFFVSLLGIIFSFFAYFHFIRPIRKFQSLVESIAIGDTSHKIEGLNRNDEMGDIARSIAILNENIEKITKHTDLIASGNYSAKLVSKSKQDKLVHSIQIMTEKLRQSASLNKKTSWMQEGRVEIAKVLRDDVDQELLGDKIIHTLATYTTAQVATLFVVEDEYLKLTNTYAYSKSEVEDVRFKIGEGLVGEVALNNTLVLVKSIPKDYLKVKSSLGEGVATALVLVPFSFHGELRGVIELAYFQEVSEELLEFLQSITESLAVAYENVASRVKLHEALAKAQRISEELQVQEEELRVSNETLQEQSDTLKIQKKNLEITGKELTKKAIDLENASKYKSEFLANMSHELRTPLNSLLILSRSLADNDDKNLSEDEVESAHVIQESGEHLLSLINDILDISKVEAGQMLVSMEEVNTEELLGEMHKRFNHMAQEKHIKFSAQADASVPKYFSSDRKKLGQIITNLISNALKFTHKGEVKLIIEQVDKELCFHVKDSGIGIPKDKQESIFEAFRQADGSTTRNFGGTGLGLSIARNFSKLLKGSIDVESVENVGSTFTLKIPCKEEKIDTNVKRRSFKETQPPFKDSRESIDKDQSMFLIIEDDVKFAKILYDNCLEHGDQAIVASDGETGVILAKRYDIKGIILDYMLPGLDGSDILAILKEDKKTKHIPVHVMSALDNLMDMKQLGAIGQDTKPISAKQIKNVLNTFDDTRLLDEVGLFTNHVKSTTNISSEITINDEKINLAGKKILLVDDDMRNTYSLAKIFRAKKLEVFVASNGKKAIELLEKNSDIDMVLMDIMMPDMDGYTVTQQIRKMQEHKEVPIIAVTANAMKGDKEKCLDAGANDYMSKPIDIDKLFVMIQMWL